MLNEEEAGEARNTSFCNPPSPLNTLDPFLMLHHVMLQKKKRIMDEQRLKLQINRLQHLYRVHGSIKCEKSLFDCDHHLKLEA
jgi:hypothetical protein